MKKACLIRCPSPFLLEDWVFPPIGLLSVGTGLKQRGWEVFIHDGQLVDIPMDYPYYGLGPTSPEYTSALQAKDLIRRYNPSAKIILGGPYATINATECLKDGWDAVVWGDGEIITEEAFLKDTLFLKGESRPLDEYPIPDRDLVNLKKYKCYLEGQQATTLVTSRGCPNHCGFCCKNYSHVRFLSTRKTIEEISLLYNKYHYKALLFPEDIFIINRKRTEEVCEYLKGIDLYWRCLIRADYIVRYGTYFVKMLKESGLVEVGMGIESGSNKILKIINKGESVETIKESIRMLKGEGIRVKGFFIIGLPGETKDTLNETTQFLEEMGLDDIDAKIFQPYPGSPIWDHRDKYDISWDEQEQATTFYKGRPREYYGNIRTSKLSTEDIYKAWVTIEGKYKRFFPIVKTGEQECPV
jgi:anaerobic magnesium-protoporphyrin IX monomethyl ester cyclase